MPKNIVLLSDGTGNSAAKLTKTNVWRLYQALDLTDPDKQIAFYDDGVGTSSFKPLAVIGGAFGYGLKRNVLDLYTFLCRNYQDGDRIFCFGFSRGAFTIRSLAGLIAFEGLVSHPTEAGLMGYAKTAYREYRRERFPADIPLDKIGRAIRDMFVGDKNYAARRASHPHPPITFLGVWDTVAAYGLPIDELTRALNWVWRLYPKDREPHPAVQRLCHAIALDDERNTFHPMLFNEEHEPGGNAHTNHIREERVTQVWFTGMHSNVGGGYPDDSLSQVSLKWMIDQADAAGLSLKPKERSEIANAANALGKLYDSRRGAGGFYRYLPRRVTFFTQDTVDKDSPVIVVRPKIHESVLFRIAKSVDRYAPIGLPAHYAVVTDNGQIVDSAEFLEHPTQAESRANRQERIWNLVWWKRVTYFTSIIVACLLIAFPLYRHPTGACEGRLCFISPVIGWVGAVLPGFLSPWLDAYYSHPSFFATLFVAFILLLQIGNRLQGKIFDGMRGLWDPGIVTPRTTGPIEPLPSDRLFRLRTSPLYQWFFLLMKRRILPAVFAALAVCMLAGTASRLSFKALVSSGAVCSPENGGVIFQTNSPCWYYDRLNMEAGKKYRITLKVKNPAEYKDKDILTSLAGFGASKMPWIHPFALFFRRHLGDQWYKPYARIGEEGTDEYVLNPADGSQAGPETFQMISEFTARRQGRLYFFVNDAVLPVPNSWQYFYRNNHGEVEVQVELLTEPSPK